VGLVPGALYVTTLSRVEVAWLGVRYLDAEANWRGDLAFAFFMGTLGLLIVRALRRNRQGADTARGELFGLVALAVTGINDSLVSAGVLAMPYVLDIGYLVLVVAVSYELARAFVKNAHELRTAQEELVQKARLAALGEMSAVVAHEVRNPVAIIFNAIATLRKSKEPPEPLFDIVQEEAERLKRMVTDLLEFARPQSLVVVEADIHPIVESALEAVRLAMKDVAVAIEVNLPEDLPRVACDERLLRQALINLISNALQAPDRRGAVEVVARVDERALALGVIDHGRGVSEEVASRIFVPFFTTRPTGTGLGLPVVRRIAEAHGGEVRLVTTPGGGATFEMWLPIAGPKAS
jgi:signal transduction histidine kinase